MIIIKKIVLVGCLFSLMAGCHTVKGAGQDVSAGGHAITRAAS